LTLDNILIGGISILHSFYNKLIVNQVWSLLDDLLDLLGFCLAWNLQNVLDEQASWLLHNIAKDHWVRNVENILDHDLSTWYPFGPLVPKGCPLVHSLKWLPSFLGVDVQLVPDGS